MKNFEKLLLIVVFMTAIVFNAAAGGNRDRIIDIIDIIIDGTQTSAPASDSPSPGDEIVSSIGISMVWIPAGTFTRGSNIELDFAQPPHQVTLTNGFYMGRYEVTQAQWRELMGTNIQQQERYYHGGVGALAGVGDNFPMYYVNWFDAIVFCNRLSIKEGLTPAYSINNSTNPAAWGSVPASWDDSTITVWDNVTIVANSTGYRLPTEAQWEYACRAGTTTAYNTGNTITDNTGWYRHNSADGTSEAGGKPANAWGLYDMHGNVSEWVWDRLDEYTAGAKTDPTGPSATDDRVRVLRGGSWNDYEEPLRSAYRDSFSPEGSSNAWGFRLVRP